MDRDALLSAASLAERTLALCRIPSVTGDERALCDQLETWAQQHFAPAHIRRIGHSLVLGNLQSAKPRVALAGHLDTVPPNPADPPSRIEGERVVALGASDMKGGVAVMLALAEALKRDALPYELVLVLYEREEGPYADNGLEPVFAALPELKGLDLAICMEPTDGELQVGCVGSLHATVTFHGKSAHSARPWQGKNAVHAAGAFLNELAVLEPKRVELHGLPYFQVTNVTRAQGGRARNVIPERFELGVNHRFCPGTSLEQAQADLLALVAGRAEVLFTDLSPSGPVSLDHALVQRLRRLSGATVAAKQAWTDVARFGVHGIAAINYGPGATAQAHQAGEWCPVPPLETAARHLRALLEGRDA